MTVMKGIFRLELLRFILVGCVNTAFSYSLYALFLWCGLHFASANLLAFVISLLFSFWMQGRWVFRHLAWQRLWRFVLAWCAIYLVNIGLIALIISAGLTPYEAGALALVPVTLMSYVIQKLIVFRRSEIQRSI
ncbi:GtrA family protein [Roseateles sp.]|jgi:putative flippase GtrA|uniref:GtrA family protein n=1 Tax=Roseateles sp. TaxID=1971397 RepID=UPI003BAA7989